MSIKCHFETSSLAAAIPAYNDTTGYFDFGFTASKVIINYRNGGAPLFFSFSGSEDHGVLFNSSGYMKVIELDVRTNQVWIRGGDGTTVVDIWGIPNQG